MEHQPPADDVVAGAGDGGGGARRTFSQYYKMEHRKAPDFKWWQIGVLSYQSLGIIYGDLGTSPLYVFSTVTLPDPGEEDFLGILSLILWTLTLIGLLKYTFVVLHADDHGEDVTPVPFCIKTKPSVPLQFQKFACQKESCGLVAMGFRSVLLHTRLLPEGGTFALYSLLRQHVNFSGSMPMPVTRLASDINLKFHSKKKKLPSKMREFLERSTTAQSVITYVVLIATSMVMGDGALTPAISVLSAVQGIQSRSPKITQGAEAMFADLGHFNKSSIQAAFLIKNPSKLSTTFYSSTPEPLFWPMFIIATLSAIVASQALISASFSIIRQSIALGCFPRVTMKHTSEKYEGQVYSPEVNYFLMITCIVITYGFKGGPQIGQAFGTVVIWVMLFTTTLMTVVMVVIWQTNIIAVGLFFAVFFCIEGIYMTSLLNKVLQGGWVPFANTAFFLAITMSWTYGRRKKNEYDAANLVGKQEFIKIVTGSSQVPGICIFCTDLMNGIPPIVRHYVKHTGSIREVMVFVTVRILPVRSVLPEERLLVDKLDHVGVYRCILQYGYMDNHNMDDDDFVVLVVASLKQIADNDEILLLDSAFTNGTSFVIGRTILKMSITRNCFKRFVINNLYRFLQKNFRSNMSSLRIAPGKTLQVGMHYEI
ncbi:Potassium transporter 26 [Triticum urartu]|uniref:Potassium transporter 26 n=1 Tax=Triticum urartu TaxID=4572 RepID=M8AQ45_TRIUA|nr:Potassium transporter 26 [Triticum urartu]